MIGVNWDLPTEFNDNLTCVSWTLARLLRFYGIDDPSLVFGTSLGFRLDRATQELLWWPPDWVEPAGRLYGLTFREHDVPDFDRGWERIVERLRQGHPTIVVVDANWLTYSPYFGRGHFGHCITVVGYEPETWEATVVDAGASRYLGPMPLDDLRRAMDLHGLPRGGTPVRYFEIVPPPEPPRLDPVRVRSALQAGLRGLRGEGEPAGVAAGLAGVREYRAALDLLLGRLLRDREGAAPEFKGHHFACFFWGEQRMWYGRFLEQAGRLLGDPAFEGPARVCLELFEDWRLLSAMFIKALAWDAAAMVARMQRRLDGIIGLEEQALCGLERLLGRGAEEKGGEAG
ncbi:MAG: BtrH N-terminal domain-containing protein [Acetobacteraceae bacterium]|nr:BtrH N-terminal domain-containing protein [Acetobacteraceae bacterium]